ncbi:hypothetical protein DRQ07_04385 [candidate division KSB1 bacterium]|nr:MAG: hypothetical protein DRQ07_04385 [candidate division KSB1 bacterium]
MPPRIAAKDTGIKNFDAGNPLVFVQLLIIGIKDATIGVLFRKAENPATGNNIRIYRTNEDVPVPPSRRIITVWNRPDALKPPLTTNKKAIVISPLLEKPAKPSSTVITLPIIKRMSAARIKREGLKRSFASAIIKITRIMIVYIKVNILVDSTCQIERAHRAVPLRLLYFFLKENRD